MQHGADAAARGIAYRVDGRPVGHGVKQGLDGRGERRAVARDGSVDGEVAASDEDGGSVAADVARNDDGVACFGARAGGLSARQQLAEARRRDEDAVDLAAPGDFRVARDDAHAGSFSRLCHRGGDGVEVPQRESFLNLEGAGEVARHGAHAGEVVDRAADAELADVAARELPGRDDEAVRREGGPVRGEVADGQDGRVVGGEVGVLEVMRKDARDERGRLAAARAVRECDAGIIWEFSSHDHNPP